MTELKTKKNRASVKKYINTIENEKKREDCFKLIEIMTDLTDEKPAMWGDSIIGFGSYHYKYKSGTEGDWPATGFSPRKQNISIYIMIGFKKYPTLMEKLGKYKNSISCLYIKSLDDIHLPTLRKLLKCSYNDIKKMYPD